MVVALIGLLNDINEAKRKYENDVAARLDFGQNGPNATRSGSKRPSNAGAGFKHSTWYGTANSSPAAPGKGMHPLLKSNLSEKGCPQTAPGKARGANYGVRLGRSQCTGLYQEIHGTTGQTTQVLYNPNNPVMARLQKAHDNMGYPAGYQPPAQVQQPIQGQGKPVPQQQQMQQPPQTQQPVYTPPQSYVHPDNQSAEVGANCTGNCAPESNCSSATCTKPIPSPVETTPVSTGTVETPPEVEIVSGVGFFVKLTLFILLSTIAAVAWYFYQRFFGKRKVGRAPRRWETIRSKVMHKDCTVSDRINYGHNTQYDLESGYGNMGHRQHHSLDNQVPISSYQAPHWERISKGSKFV